MFLPQEAGTSGKGIAKATPKIEKIYIVNFDKEYLLCLQSSASGIFCKHVLIFAEKRLKFSHIEGIIIP